MPRYDAKRIEAKWQAHWDQHETFVTPNEPPAGSQGKLYVLDMFPYPSGAGLHVGHPEGYTATDIVARHARMRGKHVLHPMGWDAFGLPAEQHAINTGTHPRVTTYENIDNFRRQLKMLGFSYDWSRELSTTDEEYYKWTQWIFLELFDTWYDPGFEWTGPDGQKRIGKGRPIAELPIPEDVESQGVNAVRDYQDAHRLAYQSEAPVNWCPALGTVLANEEVTAEGKSERGNHPVERRPLRQWMLRITAYAERLLTELEEVDWSESIKILQRNWIGKSVGAEVDFFVASGAASAPRSSAEGRSDRGTHIPRSPEWDAWRQHRADAGFPRAPEPNVIRVYTTRPDTLFGATYMVLAPEHPLVDTITTDEQRSAVEEYVKKATLKSDLDRTDLAREKSGVFTGAYAINPVNGERIPIWIADYVLISYGTGAIMAVPAHDERDWEFAKAMGIPIRRVVTSNPDRSKECEEVIDRLLERGIHRFGMRVESSNVPQSIEDDRKALEGLQFGHLVDFEIPQNEEHCYYILFRNESPPRYWPPLGVGTPITFELDRAYTFIGTAINSGQYDGLMTPDFKRKITDNLTAAGLGREAVNYRLRDWLFSRQRYWGEPFPIWHELDENGDVTGRVRAAAVEELPVTLPEMEDFKPKGTPDPPLSWAPDEWLYRTAEDGTRLKRETNTMPQWAGSCWYYLRFCDNKNRDRFIDSQVERYWLPVDLYVGGAEHAVLHLLYSRFWHKVLFDRGHVSTTEPFRKLVNQGMILGEAELTAYVRGQGTGDGGQEDSGFRIQDSGDGHQDSENRKLKTENPQSQYVSAKFVKEDKDTRTGEELRPVKLSPEQVEKRGDAIVLKENPEIVVESRAFKMSKSRGNVINPDDVVQEYGADSLRLYEMFMGPLEQVKPWSMSGVEGVFRFLSRVWRMVVDADADEVTLHPAVQDVPPTAEQERILHKTIKAVSEDIEKLSLNTAISRMMEFTNAFTGFDPRPRSCLEPFVLLLSPFAPHLAEELWEVLGHGESLAYHPWPDFDEAKIAESEIEIPVQVNGKLRAKIRVPAKSDQAAMQQIAEADETVQSHIGGKQVVKVICVPNKLVNFVVKG
jgi:leucyl-tRNA synthetase